MFSYQISNPNNIGLIADWIELKIAFTGYETAKDSVASDIESAKGSEADEDMMNDIWQELRIRREWYGDVAPYELEGKVIIPNIHWKSRPEYVACLIWALEGNPNTVIATSGEAGKLFERICNKVIRKYLNGQSIIYGFPSEQTLEDIAKVINERFIYKPPNYRKDRNLDIIAWQPHNDNRSSQLVLLAQCASGNDWPKKLKELNLDAWTKYIHFSSCPIKAFAFPAVVSDRIRFHENSVDAGILFDRCRIYRYTEDGHFEDDSLRSELISWCDGRLNEMLQ